MSVKNNSTVGEKIAKLAEVVSWFDSDDFELEQALDKFTEAEKLAEAIEHDLLALKNNIDIVKAKFSEAK